MVKEGAFDWAQYAKEQRSKNITAKETSKEGSPTPTALLLLPLPFVKGTRSRLWTACRRTISTALGLLAGSGEDDKDIARLDLAIVLPFTSLSKFQNVARSVIFARSHGLLEEIYSLLCVIAAQEKVDLDFPGGLDVRAFMVDHPDNYVGGSQQSRAFSGPLIDLSTLILSGRVYGNLFAVESEEGERAKQTYMKYQAFRNLPLPSVTKVPGGTFVTTSEDHEDASAEDLSKAQKHTSVAVGGTFDHLHVGHKLLLTATALVLEPYTTETSSSLQRTITIGITGDELLTKKRYAEQVESWERRQAKVADFLESVVIFARPENANREAENFSYPGPNGCYVRVSYDSALTIKYVQISDPYGPTITDENISALVISAETRAGARAVNEKRKEKEWAALEIFEVDVLDANVEGDATGNTPGKVNFESKISSTEVRRRLHEMTV